MTESESLGNTQSRANEEIAVRAENRRALGRNNPVWTFGDAVRVNLSDVS